MTDNFALIDNKYLLGVKSIVGDTRRQYEDRATVENIETKGGLSLVVAIVADGVGSADNGGLAAQMSIDIVIANMRQSHENNIPKLIVESIKLANRDVYRDVMNRGVDASTTITVAVIHKDRVFIGNVGDSRAYWIQESGKMLQLTQDHSYFNVYGGEKNSESAEMLVNAIGLKDNIYVDLGFYVNGNDRENALMLGKAGLPLKIGESILLCSDGLIKSNLKGERYVTDEEIIDAVQSELQASAAAVKLCSFAEGRNVDDNVSVVTINYTDESRIENSLIKKQKEEQKSKIRIAGLVFIIILLVLGLGYGVLRIIKSQSEIEELLGRPTAFAQITVMVPTLTPTEFVPVAPGEMRVDYLVQENSGSYRELNGIVDANLYPLARDLATNQSSPMNVDFTYKANLNIQTNDLGVMLSIGSSVQNDENNRVFIFEDSEVGISYTDKLKIDLFAGDLFVELARGEFEVEINLPNNHNSIAYVKGSKMIVDTSGDDVYLWCLEGECRLEFSDGLSFKTAEKMWRRYRPGLSSYDEAFPIEVQAQDEWNFKCVGCIAPLPEPTPTPTPRIFVPENDAENEEEENPVAPLPTTEPTNPPAKKPTKKPTTEPTEEPTASPTYTSVPPTAIPPTQVPPTSVPPTAVPPTSPPPTQVPPTSVPPTAVPPTSPPPTQTPPTEEPTKKPKPTKGP